MLRAGWPWVVAAVALGAALLWLIAPIPRRPAGLPAAAVHPRLAPGAVATMDSPPFHYSPGWRVDARGADPVQPANPWIEPSGVITFDYAGRELALNLALGDFWGYLFVTVDGEPANRLAHIPGNADSRGQPGGYRTLYAPERQSVDGPAAAWVPVHRADEADGVHQARVEVWRSWGQTPVRGVAVDGLPAPPRPAWPMALLLLVAAGGIVYGLARLPASRLGGLRARRLTAADWLRPKLRPPWAARLASPLAGMGLAVLALAAGLDAWAATLLGLALLAAASVQRLAWWAAALVCALPFYYAWPLPILPGRVLSLVDIGVLGGSGLLLVHWLLSAPAPAARVDRNTRVLLWLLALLAAWALVSTAAAANLSVALREWRLVFLYAPLFGLLVAGALHFSPAPGEDRWRLAWAWLAGAAAVATIALWQYASGAMTIDAEGVTRVRAFYGSPNNLALYLERTLAVSLGLALFVPGMRARLLAGVLAALQGLALLLTFSKGSIFLALPAMLASLWLGGYWVLGRQGRSRRILWALAAATGLATLALVPFLRTERFAGLLDFSQGTDYLRLQLWRSAWQMALDHPLFGVGPDNFLYAYRSLYLLPTAWQEPNLNHPHNWPLDWWTRLGLPGLVLGTAFFGLGLWTLWRKVRWPLAPAADAALSVGLLAAAAAALAHGLIDASYALPDLMLVWVFMFTIQSTNEPVSQ